MPFGDALGLGKLGGAMASGGWEMGWRWALPQRGQQELAGEERLWDAGMLAREAAPAVKTLCWGEAPTEAFKT